MNNENYNEELHRFRDELIKINEKSNDQFEKQLTYISAGSLGGSMLVIEKIFKDISSTEFTGFLILGWIFLGSTLLLNMFSHLYAAKLHNQTISELNENRYNYSNAVLRNKKISNFNSITLSVLLIGIFLLLFYTSYNILNMKKQNITFNNEQTKGLPSSPPPVIHPVQPSTGQPSSPPPPPVSRPTKTS